MIGSSKRSVIVMQHQGKSVKQPPEESRRIGKVKLAFLYILIGGLVISALISVTAILIGEFSSVIQKALLTIFLFVVHGLLILAIVSADKNNQLGRAILPTVVLGAVLANMITSTLGTWGIWSDDISWRAYYFYFLAIGSALMINETLRLRLNQTVVISLTNLSVGIITVWSLMLVPWIFVDHAFLGEFYFRLVGALTILAVTSVVITSIVRGISLAQHPELKASIPVREKMPAGMAAILITFGSIAALVWFFGLFVFLITAAQAT